MDQRSCVIFMVLLMCCGSTDITLHRLQQRAATLMTRNGGSTRLDIVEARNLFQDFVQFFKRSYIPNTAEYEYRSEVFMNSLERQRKLNKEEKELKGTAQYGLNKFSDFTPDEFEEFLGKVVDIPYSVGKPIEIQEVADLEAAQGSCILYPTPVPKAKNWVKEGKVTSVKNQGVCGSCWAFSGAEQVESYWAIAKHRLMNLSVQELLSCAPSLGCGGGNTCAALLWLAYTLRNGSKIDLVPASEYPYVDRDTQCEVKELTRPGAHISSVCGCQRLVGDEQRMKLIVALKGPLAVNVNAVMWHDYVGGIIQYHCTNLTMNHAVQLVGYDVSGEVPYWILRNSWGPDFGEKGYLRVKYGENTCGVAEGPSYIEI